jgi:3-hydroxyacyl-CoA dehydrogenase
MSQLKIRRAAVLGAGVMGAQIAAHLAAAGVRVQLLDLSSDEPPQDPKLAKMVGANFRSARSILAIKQLGRLKPNPLVSNAILANIIPGNFDDDMSVLGHVDWIIEAVAEKIEIKKSIHSKIAEHAPDHIPITTNTSGISVADMAEHFSGKHCQNFFGTHFFNPPRYLHLVEIIPHTDSNRELMKDLSHWIEERLGKGIVDARDTVNFIANRIGVYNLQITLKHMEELNLNIETVDALTGSLMGRPASATFRTVDVVGLDTYAHTTKNVYDRSTDDPHRHSFAIVPWMQELIEKGALGQKSDSIGCYKKTKNAQGRTEILSYRPETKTYEQQEVASYDWMKEASKISELSHRLKFVFAQSDDGAEFIWRVMRDTMVYAAQCLEDIAEGLPKSLDDAICWGFNWKMGPLELWQGVGYELTRQRMIKDGAKLPGWCEEGCEFYHPLPGSEDWMLSGATEMLDTITGKFRPIERPQHEYRLPKFRTAKDDRVVISNDSVSMLDLGDGVACLNFHSKLNTLNDSIIELSQEAIGLVERDFRAMVIGNQGDHFSAGADLRKIMGFIDSKDFKAIDQLLRQFQGTMQMIKYASFPTVAAPHHLTLGGGCEVSLHTSSQVLGSELYAGLVEIGVGLIPAGGGTKELALRAYEIAQRGEKADVMPFLNRAFQIIGTAKVSTSGAEAIEMGLYDSTASVCLSQPHLIHRAKNQAIYLAEQGYITPLARTKIQVAGDPGIQTFKIGLYNMQQSGFITEYEMFIGEQIATVLCGGAVHGGSSINEEDFLNIERNVFVELCQQPKTRERIEHMLKTGKPIRN